MFQLKSENSYKRILQVIGFGESNVKSDVTHKLSSAKPASD